LLVTVLLVACGGTPEPAAGPPVLAVKGMVDQELNLSMEGLKALGVQQITAEHPKNGSQDYEGVLLSAVLDEAGVKSGATALVFTASDEYQAEVTMVEVEGCADCLIAIGATGSLTMVMPGLPSKAWVKSVVSIEVK
jgi:hypothetical protein